MRSQMKIFKISILIAISLVITFGVAFPQIYQWIDKNGIRRFGDELPDDPNITIIDQDKEITHSDDFYEGDNEFTRETLRGIKSVFVEVAPIDPEIENAGLTERQIQTDVELKLRIAGLNVSALGKRNTATMLYVDPNIRKHHELSSSLQADVYIFSIDLEVQQGGFLYRAKKLTVATTWSTGVLGVTVHRLDVIRSAIKDRVDVFLNAWLSVNPKS